MPKKRRRKIGYKRKIGRHKLAKKAVVVRVTESEEIPKTIPKNGLTLVYWNIRGLCQPIRLALAYANVRYKDVRIDPGDPER